ncbi:MAG: Mov34/MPN/PAD-1 family protein [Promethearchaeota archaeon]
MVVIIPKQCYLAVVAAAVRFANARIPKDDWLEVSGIFIGKNKGDNVIITQTYPIMHQELDKDAVIDQYKWSDEDYVALSIIDDEAFERGEFTVGWWHSHPDFKVMMSHIDIRTTLSYQQNNPKAISLVFNPTRLIRQIELANKKGDPDIQLKNDPGFKIFRLDDVNSGVEASYHTTDYRIEGYESMEQLIAQTQKFIIDVTNFFPKDNVPATYSKFIDERIEKYESLFLGTEEYLTTLTHRGEKSRIPEVLENQSKEIRKFVSETLAKIENIKEFMNYLEYKEREVLMPQIEEIINRWDEHVSGLDKRLKQLKKRF